MWETVATKIGIKAVEKIFDYSAKDEKSFISIGLAVGYFYNFLEPISRLINNDDLKLFSSKDDEHPEQFESEEVKVQILTPKRLDVYAYDSCEVEFKKYKKGFIYLKENKRYYGINYLKSQLEHSKQITIVDLARPLLSVKRFYEEIQKIDTHKVTNEKWNKTQHAEITAFKETINNLLVRGYGTLVNKVVFSEMG